MIITTKVVGVDKVKKDMKILDQRVRGQIVESMGRAATIIETEAKLIITRKGHVKTGNLRRSISHKVGWAGVYKITGVIGTDVPYAPYIEALPDGGFLYPALIKKSEKALKYLGREIKRIIEK